MSGYDADVLIVGSGVAGLSAAVRAAERGLRVLVVTKGELSDGNTRWAQGGVAVVLPGGAEAGDSVAAHIADTLTAGGGLCAGFAVTDVLSGGPAAVRRLQRLGAVFDRAADGSLARTREGGHGAYRVVHAGGDATGAEVQRALEAAVVAAPGVSVRSGHTAVELLRTRSGAVGGLLALDIDGAPVVLRAPAVVLATGGLGQLYRSTTNPAGATADGLALALRAGAAVSDLEFVQFHPTVLYTSDGAGHRPLVTEAVRGEGARLLDAAGRPVMDGVHPLGDLAPRDVVSAAITRRLAEAGGTHVFLDATALGARFATRFPTVHGACLAAGIDPAHRPIPVAPAAHFSCGGVGATVDGRTSVAGLYAVGEVARTGLHGANRLASNSLLEGLVTGARAADAVTADLSTLDDAGVEPCPLPAAAVAERAVLQRLMTEYASIGRDAAGLRCALAGIQQAAVVRPLWTRAAVEDAALTLAARCLLTAALRRTESRGCHVRTDHPDRDAALARELPVRLDVAGALFSDEKVSAA